MMKTKIVTGIACLLSAACLPAQVCSPMTTVARYLVVCDGYLAPAANAPLAPAKILGTATGDETGTFRGKATVSLGGQIVSQEVTGTEKLNRDCTGTITYAQTLGGQPGPPLNITAVVSQQGERIDGLVTDAGAVLSCVLRRLSNEDPAGGSASAAQSKELTASRSVAAKVGSKESRQKGE